MFDILIFLSKFSYHYNKIIHVLITKSIYREKFDIIVIIIFLIKLKKNITTSENVFIKFEFNI